MESADVHQLYVSIRKLMLNSAMQIATMLEESSQRFEIGAIFPLAVQQGALAASVNLSSMMRKEECSMRGSASQHLEFLQRFFSDMSAIQAPAERLLKSLFKLRSLGDGTGIPMQAWQTPGPSQDEDGVGSTEYMHPNADGTPWRREQSEHGHVHGNSFDNAEHQQDKTVSPRAGNSRTAMEQAWGADIIRASGDTTAAVISPSASDPSGAAAGCAPAPQHIRASSNRPERDLGPLTPSLAAADMHIDHFSSNTHDQELPTFPDPAANEWDDADAVSVSWSETFKALGAVNRRTAGEKMSANEFGDVMGCVFQL